MYAYSANDPLSDADISFSNNPHGSKPVYLMHRSQFADDQLPSDVKVWDLRNYQVNLELGIFFQSTTIDLRDWMTLSHKTYRLGLQSRQIAAPEVNNNINNKLDTDTTREAQFLLKRKRRHISMTIELAHHSSGQHKRPTDKKANETIGNRK